MALLIAALFVATNGIYFNRPSVDPWDITRDARLYQDGHRVIAHPPCERWGRYWSGGPSAKVRRVLGDDGGCFESALASVRRCGGVLEHPEASHAFKRFGLTRPPKRGGWVQAEGGWTCCVEQGHYGHPARKATWLYYVRPKNTGSWHYDGRDSPKPRDLIWGPSKGTRLDEGFHSSAERLAARAAGQKPVARLSKTERTATPEAFANLLIDLVDT